MMIQRLKNQLVAARLTGQLQFNLPDISSLPDASTCSVPPLTVGPSSCPWPTESAEKPAVCNDNLLYTPSVPPDDDATLCDDSKYIPSAVATLNQLAQLNDHQSVSFSMMNYKPLLL